MVAKRSKERQKNPKNNYEICDGTIRVPYRIITVPYLCNSILITVRYGTVRYLIVVPNAVLPVRYVMTCHAFDSYRTVPYGSYCGTVRYSTERYRYGTVPYGTVRYRTGAVPYGKVPYRTVQGYRLRPGPYMRNT